jgi:hypothetical protein
MRGLRSFGGLLVALIALGGYLYFVESKRPAGSEGDKKEKAFTVEADKIEELTIKSESGERTTLKKNGSDWQIVQPATGKPDSAEVSGITTNLASLEIQRVIDENPTDLAEYNLAQPRVELTFKTGGKDHKLLIGRKTPPGSDLYARLDDQKRVVLIPSFLDTTFNRKTFDLRDKAVLKVNRDEIGSLVVTTPTSTMRFEKTGGEWKMVQPVPARADFSAVEGLVSRLTTLQMKSIAAQQAEDLVQYGLDKPVATVTIGSGSSQATLAVGKSSGEGAVFARDLSKPVIVTIESALVDELKKAPADYRQKDLFDARAFNANRLELLRNGVTTTFEKVKSKNKEGQEQDTWKQVAPSARDVDQMKVDNLISAITQTRASSFVDAPTKGALDKPELTVTIKSNDGKRDEKVAFGRAGTDVFASRTGEPGAAKLDAAALDGIVKALEEIK